MFHDSMKDISGLEKNLGVEFKNKDLLKQALVHRSYINENPGFSLEHNERLEFLGDAVLELVVTEYLYRNYKEQEGILTSWRAALVNSNMLADFAAKLNVNDYLFLSRGESKDEGRARQYILGNTFEALMGAIYLDQGYKTAQEFIERTLLLELPRIIEEKLFVDSKSKFQEEAQERVGITPDYQVLKEWGPDHAKQFKIGVFLEKELVGQGEGPSKQSAQQAAAENALKNKGWD